MSASAPTAAIVEARAGLLEAAGREAASLAVSIEGLRDLPAFRTMATASLAARPQWAGMVDDLFERPLLKLARAELHNALMATLRGETLYRNVFFSFADAVVLWHYGHTQERTGQARLQVTYAAMLRLLAGADRFLEARQPAEPDAAFFHRLRRVALTRDDAYPVLRRAARLLGAVEAAVTSEKLHPVRGTMLMSYASFSAQVIAMARAAAAGRSGIDRSDVIAGMTAFTTLCSTAPEALRDATSVAADRELLDQDARRPAETAGEEEPQIVGEADD
ncbi:MAG TPA: hypothetical protein VET65_07040 [Candidatus Limnocylindrales bacterium]|nr:hypothetical protein [Candidatus Limnocylindrales bacterium]